MVYGWLGAGGCGHVVSVVASELCDVSIIYLLGHAQ